MNKILADTKELLGVPADVKVFDSQLIMHINATFTTLNQLGVGPVTPYQTSDTEGNLEDFIEDVAMQSLTQMYLYAKVRLLFDPPTSSITLGALQNAVNEYEWRLMNPIQ